MTEPSLEEIEQDEQWRIDGDRTATWALRKIREAEAELDRIDQLARDEHQRIADWATEAMHGPCRTIAFFTGHLVRYRRDLEADNPKLPATYKLPDGNLTRRASPVRVIVDDEQAFLEWAGHHAPQLVKRTALPGELRQWRHTVGAEPGESDISDDTGERVPGVHVRRDEPRYDAKATP